MNGAPLPVEYGAPLRLYSAVKLGYKMVKYLTEVSFLPARTGGYWEDQGYEWFAGCDRAAVSDRYLLRGRCGAGQERAPCFSSHCWW